MASTKIVLRKKKTKDGSYPLAIRITKDRSSSFIHLGKTIKESDWDEIHNRVRKSHPNSGRLNNFLIKKLSEANDKILELETQKNSLSSRAIKSSIKPAANDGNFFSYAELYLNNFKTAGKYNRYYPDQSRINRFREFVDGRKITFQEITVALLTRFKAWLKGKHKASDRSIVNHLIIIRTIFNLAIRENRLDVKHYPFGKDKIKIKLPDSIKIGLTIEEVKMIESLDLKDHPYLHHCRNLWLFSFYFAGMRISDVLRLKWSDFQDSRLAYQMGKNSKGGSLKSNDKALLILSEYEDQKKSSDDVIFPELKNIADFTDTFEVQRIISYAVKRIDENLSKVALLAGINKKLTTHIARHTFGNLSGDKIPIQMLQKLYRHSSITTTIGYQSNFIHKDADEALDAVVGF